MFTLKAGDHVVRASLPWATISNGELSYIKDNLGAEPWQIYSVGEVTYYVTGFTRSAAYPLVETVRAPRVVGIPQHGYPLCTRGTDHGFQYP